MLPIEILNIIFKYCQSYCTFCNKSTSQKCIICHKYICCGHRISNEICLMCVPQFY